MARVFFTMPVAQLQASKGSTIVTGSEMPPFLAYKLEAAGGDTEKSKLVRFNSEGVCTDGC